jgi:thiamine-monophosphate kinase
MGDQMQKPITRSLQGTPVKRKMNTLGTPENLLIQRFGNAARASTGTLRLTVDIGDDAAVLAPEKGQELILTCDWFLEGTHFWRRKHPPDAVGWKCLSRALSDIAAMGGKPRCFLLSLAIPRNLTGRWLTEFLRGLRRAAARFSCALVGGDTTRSDKVLINITAIGQIRSGHFILRSGARIGDAIFVSGRLGEAELGLRLLRGPIRGMQVARPALKKHLYPEPRLALGQWLSHERLASSMMDLSDGLSSDLPRLCSASKMGASIDAANIPAVRVPPKFKPHRFNPLELALNGGDDYELLFTVRPANVRRIPNVFKGTRLTRIGQITAGHKLKLLFPDGSEQPLLARGWDPFRTDL